MRIQLRFFATFREAVGQRDLEREYDQAVTVGDVLVELSEEFPELKFYENGELRDYLSIMRNGRDITHLEGEETPLDDGDTISLFPPVAGGGEERVIRTFRGITPRAALHYLERVGGERIDDETVTGDGWRAGVSAKAIEIGPSLKLTEVTVEFEGRSDRLDTVIEQFSQKAVRAGG